MELKLIVHGLKEIVWSLIDVYFANELSNINLEAAENMYDIMFPKITVNINLQVKIKVYLRNRDVFNVTILFFEPDGWF